MNRFSRGWQLVGQCVQVFRQDKELILFPVLSLISCIAVIASFALPIWWYSDVLKDYAQDTESLKNPLIYVVLYLFYFANYFVTTFFNAALIACAIIRFGGGNPTLGDGLSAATARLPQILGWAAACATVGVILQLIRSRSKRGGRFVAGLLGVAWSIGTFFVVPILVVEKAGPVAAVKRSVALLRKTWGESLTANLGISLIAFLVMAPAIGAVVVGVLLIAAGQLAWGIPLVAAGMVYIVLVSLVATTLSSILLAALYLYSTTDRVPRHFDVNQFRYAFIRT
jgi:hypothetical protein